MQLEFDFDLHDELNEIRFIDHDFRFYMKTGFHCYPRSVVGSMYHNWRNF